MKRTRSTWSRHLPAAALLPLLTPLWLLGCLESSSGPTAPSLLSTGAIESKSRQLVNSERRAASVEPPVALEARLQEVAREHSRAMSRAGVVFHVDPEGRDLEARLREAGIEFRTAGENVARVSAAKDPASQAHTLFMSSAVHRDNILQQRFADVGVGVTGEDGTYWITQIFVER